MYVICASQAHFENIYFFTSDYLEYMYIIC